MIYTVTFNPSVDYVVRLKEFEMGALNRSSDTAKYAGGKGINVSRILNELGVETTALGFVGGFTGDFIESTLSKSGIKNDFLRVEGDTRINVKLKTDEETEINGAGPIITDDDLAKLEDQLTSLNESDHVVFAGSVPSNHKDVYEFLSSLLHEHNIGFSIDTEGQKLVSTLKYHPYLIKPNDVELEEIVGHKLSTQVERISACRELLSQGASNVLLTLGSEGALFVNAEAIYRMPPPPGTLKNSVGAGDSTVAGFIGKKGRGLEAQLKYAVASGSATAFNDDLAKRSDIEHLVDMIELQSIEEVK
ncbi:1-phosphofructokinase [Salinicoccus jeotgali]|uniref:Tagatose-6-phosphate kinase n=1 Tax=Salinicoccus jeotgali TaxID=381634 RepID=A0ABP7ECW2_9STAP